MNQINPQLEEELYYIPRYTWIPEGQSKADKLRALPQEQKRQWFSSLSTLERELLPYHWNFWARPKQLPPPSDIVSDPLGWQFWIILAGRGYGKTKMAAEYLRFRIERRFSKRIALIGPTYQDVIKTMVKGESGLLSVFPSTSPIKAKLIRKDNIPMVIFTKGKETVAEAYIYTGEEPERLRGPQHDFAWVDEVAAFRYLQEVWELFIAGLRLGDSKAIFTTTPKSKILAIKGFLDSPRAVITFGESRENSHNVSKGFMDAVLAVYEGSAREDEELKGRIRLDESGSLFKQAWIARNRTALPDSKDIAKYVIAIDPSGSDKKTACECGIVLFAMGKDGNAYLVKDLSKRDLPENWAKIALLAAYQYNAEIAFEKNYGGDLVPTVISLMAKNMERPVPRLIPLQASKDKHARAVPVSALVSKNKVKFVGHFEMLERQLTTWTPEDSKSPDRLDAFVWAITHLLVKLEPARGIISKPLMNF